MHIPYIQKVFQDANKDFVLVPLMVGDMKKDKLPQFAQRLLHLWQDQRTLFVVSSDFCHWGERFSFQH